VPITLALTVVLCSASPTALNPLLGLSTLILVHPGGTCVNGETDLTSSASAVGAGADTIFWPSILSRPFRCPTRGTREIKINRSKAAGKAGMTSPTMSKAFH
jgi:hypothetical protein